MMQNQADNIKIEKINVAWLRIKIVDYKSPDITQKVKCNV